MTYFIRDRNNRTIVDVDMRGANDFSVTVCLTPYSRFLLGAVFKSDLPINPQQMEEIGALITDFDHLQELRGEWHERIVHRSNEDVHEFIKRRLREVATKHGLYYTED